MHTSRKAVIFLNSTILVFTEARSVDHLCKSQHGNGIGPHNGLRS